MQDATQAVRCLTVLGRLTGVDLVIELWPLTLRIARLVSGFRRGTLSPEAMFQFEADLQDLLCQAGRLIVPLRTHRLTTTPIVFKAVHRLKPGRLLGAGI